MVKWVIPEKINTSTMGEISADWTGGKMHLKDVRRVWRGVNFLFTVSEGMEIFCIDQRSIIMYTFFSECTPG